VTAIKFSGEIEGLLNVGAVGDEGAEVGGPVFAGVLLHLLVFFVVGVAGRDESGDEGLVGRRLDADGESGGGAGGILGFVAADGVSEGVLGGRPGTVEGSRLVDPERSAVARAILGAELRAQGTELRSGELSR
jgi:hypothetical protein